MKKFKNKITNKNLLNSIENSIQRSVVTYMGMESRREWIYVYVWLIDFAIQWKLTVLYVNSIPIRKIKNKSSYSNKYVLVK